MGLESPPLCNQYYISESALASHHIQLYECFVWMTRLYSLGTLFCNGGGGGASHHGLDDRKLSEIIQYNSTIKFMTNVFLGLTSLKVVRSLPSNSAIKWYCN